MERKAVFYWLAQFAGWGAYYIFSVVLFFSSRQLKFSFNLALWVVFAIVFSVLVSHCVRWIILRGNWITFKIVRLTAISIGIAAGAAIVLELIQYGLDHLVPLQETPESDDMLMPANLLQFIFGVSRTLILFLLWMTVYYAYLIIEKSRKQEIANLQFVASRNEIELKNLRSQLNPHFLFNSLNSIRALVELDPEQAKRAITLLSALLRQSINHAKMPVVTLKSELELVESYLSLEKIRFEERMSLNLDIDQNSLSSEIPPLLIQTLVENAIKHGVSKAVNGGKISIKSKLVGKTLGITIRNTGMLNGYEKSEGIGIANTKKRLEILYGSAAKFEIAQEKDEVVVLINIAYL